MTKAAELAKMGEVLTNSQIGSRRNIAYNGAMQVAQRSDGVTGIGASSGYFTVDRYYISTSGTAGRLTMSQETITDLPGFGNALKLNCTTADTSIAAGEFLVLSHRLEGQDLQQLKKGTSEAEAVTISFYVKGNANATYALELYDAVGGRHASQLFNVTTSYNRISLTFNGDTTDRLANSNALALEINFWLHAGSNFTSGTMSADFASADNTRRATGISSFFDSTDRTFFITGLQMELGSQATPFEHRSFGEELALCQRYYTVIADGSEANPSTFGIGAMYNSTNVYSSLNLPTEMRTGPTLDAVTGTDYFGFFRNGGNDTFNSITLSISQRAAIEFYNQTEISGTAGHVGFFRTVNSSAKIALTAEL